MKMQFGLGVLAYLVPMFALGFVWHLMLFHGYYERLAIYRKDITRFAIDSEGRAASPRVRACIRRHSPAPFLVTVWGNRNRPLPLLAVARVDLGAVRAHRVRSSKFDRGGSIHTSVIFDEGKGYFILNSSSDGDPSEDTVNSGEGRKQ